MRTSSSPRPFWGLSAPPPLRSIAPACLCLLTIAVLVASPIFAQAQATDTTPAPPQDLRQTALAYRQKQNYDKAIECYTTLLAQSPADALSIKVDLGLSYKAKKDYSNAMPLFTEVAASQDKLKARAMFYIEDCYCEQGKIADAVVELTKAYNECPEARADVLLRRAARQCDIQKYKEGLADYEEFMAKYPEKTELIALFSGRLFEIKLRAAGVYDGPVALLDAEWIKAKAGNDAAYTKVVGYRLGEVCLRDTNWPKAAEVYETLLRDYPADAAEHRASLALAYKGMKDYVKAMPLLNEMAQNRVSPRSKNAPLWIADCMAEQSKYQEAVDYLKSIQSSRTDLGAAILLKLAAIHGDNMYQYKDAKSELQQIITNYPNSPEATVAEVGMAELVLFIDRKPAEARTRLDKFVSEHPDYPDMICVRRTIATCPYREGKYAEAAVLFEKALELPDTGTWHPYLMYMACHCYLSAGARADARAVYVRMEAKYAHDDWTKHAAEELGDAADVEVEK